MVRKSKATDPRIYDAPGDVTREVLTLAEYEAKHGRLDDSTREDAETVTITRRAGVVVRMTVELRQRRVRQGGLDLQE